MGEYYKEYSDYLKERFGDVKVQKLSIDAEFSCPNRDGTISYGGCIYCNNQSFTPRYCDSRDSVAEQLRKGREFFAGKYPEMKYLAYFQSFTGTHNKALDTLQSLYEEAARQDDVVGLIIGTRPDSLSTEVVELLQRLNRRLPVIVEIGGETSNDATLKAINRHHTWGDVVTAVEMLHAAGMDVGLHMIAGLPGEGDKEVLDNVGSALELPITTLKMHQLQVISGTPLCNMWEAGKVDLDLYDSERYLALCADIVKMVNERRPDVAIERFVAQAPPDMVVAPKWGLKNYQFVNLLKKKLSQTIQTPSQSLPSSEEETG